MMSQIENNLFFDQKNKIVQRLKNRIFPKGLTPAFSQKMEFFLQLFSVKKGREIRLNDVLDRKQTFFDQKNNIFQRVKNRIFPNGSTLAFSQKMDFFLQLFSVKKEPEIRLNDVLDRKQTFSDQKNNIFHRLKNRIFPKGLTHAFSQKMDLFFHQLFSVKKELEIKLNDVLDRKQTFFDQKNNIF